MRFQRKKTFPASVVTVVFMQPRNDDSCEIWKWCLPGIRYDRAIQEKRESFMQLRAEIAFVDVYLTYKPIFLFCLYKKILSFWYLGETDFRDFWFVNLARSLSIGNVTINIITAGAITSTTNAYLASKVYQYDFLSPNRNTAVVLSF